MRRRPTPTVRCMRRVLPGDDLPKRVVGLVALPSGYRGVQVTIGIAPCDTTSSIIHTPLSPSKLK